MKYCQRVEDMDKCQIGTDREVDAVQTSIDFLQIENTIKYLESKRDGQTYLL